jgi:hypothetical protein
VRLTTGRLPALRCWTVVAFWAAVLCMLVARPASATEAEIDSVGIYTQSGSPAFRLAPSDTFLVRVALHDDDGFHDITDVELRLQHGDFASGPSGPAFRGVYRFTRSPQHAWTLEEPAGSSWQIVPAMCAPDTFPNDGGVHALVFAIAPGAIARASTTGEWNLRIRVNTSSDPLPVDSELNGLDMDSVFELASADTAASFAPGEPGYARLPLVQPASGTITVGVLSNYDARLRVRGQDMIGVQSPEVFPVGAPENLVSWQLSTGDSGTLGTVFTDLVDPLPANVTEAPQTYDLSLWTDIPAVPFQSYLGALEFRLQELNGGDRATLTLPMTATVATTLAAESAIAEVLPPSVSAGASGQPFVAYLEPTFALGNSGIDRIRIPLPAGYGTPAIVQFRVGTVEPPFVDNSGPNSMMITFGRVTSPERIMVVFSVSVTTLADTAGTDLPVFFDDSSTPTPEQVATEGDANGANDGDSWRVRVMPGPLAELTVAPSNPTLGLGDTLQFSASGRDDFGNPLSVAPGWRVEGGIGSVDANGRFIATGVGFGFVIAQIGIISDTARVTTTPPPDVIQITSASQPLSSLIPGATSREILSFEVRSESAEPETLTALQIENRATGPGSPSLLDLDWSALSLIVQRGGGVPAQMVGAGSFTGGIANFTGLEIVLDVDETLTFAVHSGASLTARDGDLLDLRIADSTGVVATAPVEGIWPIDPPGGFPVDGMSAAQIGMTPVPAANLPIGARRRLALAVQLPQNGYAADVLTRLNVVNLGTASPYDDVEGVELWADNGDTTFDAANDTRLGALYFTGDRWEITGLSQAIDGAGLLAFVTVDVAATAAEGRTIRLALPSGSDLGVGMSSGNSGPVDIAVENPFEQQTSAQDRVTLAARPLSPGSVLPNAVDVPLLELVVGNTYLTDRALTGLTVTNRTVGPGSTAERDGEFRRVELRADGNGDGLLGDLATDPLLAVSSFVGGRAPFTGISWSLPADSARVLFVTGDVSPTGAADGDSLAANLATAADISFDSLSSVAATFPVTSRPRWRVDGMIAEQLGNLGAPGVTLGPGDGPVRALDVVIPRNGYANDVLRGVRFVNTGTATTTDIAELRLWRDDGDGQFEPVGDLDLGPLTPLAGVWQSPLLAEPLNGVGARLFVGLVVSGAPADSATLKLEIPIDGIVTESENRGPLDRAVSNAEPLLLSSAPLLATLVLDRDASTLGSLVNVQMQLRNIGSERINGLSPSILAMAGDGSATYVTGPTPASASLDPGQATTFTWSYQSASAGDVRWSGNASGTGAVSGLLRRALNVQSGLHQIYVQAESLACFAIQSMPFTVNQGQTDVVPLTLTFSNESDIASSAVRLRGLRVRLESGAGGAVVPADVISRVVVQEGADVYLSRTNLETTGSVMDLTFANPVTVLQDQPVTLGMRFDVAPGAVVPSFRMIVDDSTMIMAEDATSGAPVEVQLRNQSYPIRTGLARIVSAASELRLASADTAGVDTNPGLTQVPVLRLRLENPGIVGLTSDVRLGGLDLVLVDGAGQTVAEPDRWISRLRVEGPFGGVADRSVTSAEDSVLSLQFSPLVTVPLNAPLDLSFLADVASSAVPGAFRLVIRDTAAIDARDANTGERVAVRLDQEPLFGPLVTVQEPATELRVAGTPAFPAVVSVGRPGLIAFTARWRHPGAAGTAPIRIDRFVFQVQDDARASLSPATYIDALRIRWNGTVVASVTDPPSSGGISVDLGGVLLDAGAIDSMSVELDLEPTAPTGFLELMLPASGIVAVDGNSGQALATTAEVGANLPLSSGLTRLEPPARTLVADLQSVVSAVLPADGSTVVLAKLVLTNSAVPGSGTIGVQSLRFGGGDEAFGFQSVGAFAVSIEAYQGGTLWASSATLTADSTGVSLSAASPLDLDPGVPVTLEIRMVTRATGASGSFRLSVDAAGIGVLQPSSALLTIAVVPVSGRAFPEWTDLTSYSGGTLAASYGNFPNPFPAGRGSTSFVFYLPASGQVDLTIWTSRGERVVRLLDNASLGSGLHQALAWDGRNGKGLVVTNGVYVAELVARLDDGTRERLLRKVMVVR